jgi:capsular exopolysaccharide synthesis family protein
MASPLMDPGMMAPVPSEGVEKNWRDTLRGVLAHKRTILLMSVLVAIGPIIAIWTLKKPVYEAYGQVRVRPIVPFLVFRTEDNGAVPYYQSFLNTQVGLIHSPVVLQRALEHPDVQATGWYQEDRRTLLGHRKGRIEALTEELSVWPRLGTELIDVSLQTEDPTDGAVVVNAVLDEYMRYIRENTDVNVKKVLVQLVEEYTALDVDIRERRDIIDALGKRLGTTDPEELVARQRVRVDETEAQLATMQRALSMARRRQEEARKRLNARGKQTSTSEERADVQQQILFSNDPEWRRLRQRVSDARYQVERLSQRLGQAHPQMIDLVRQVAYAEKLLQTREEELQRMPVETVAAGSDATATVQPMYLSPEAELENLRREISLREYEKELLTQDLKRQRESWEQSFDAAQMLARELEGIRQKQDLQDAVRSRLEQKRMEDNVPGAVEVLSRAIVPDSPARDQRLVLTGLAVFGSLMAGVGIAFLRAGANPIVSQAEEFTAASVPFLGHLPRVHAKDRGEVLSESMLGESIRMVRTPLLRRIAQASGNTVLITSAEQGVGKTTLAILLARSIAQCGKRVLLVDADLRRPRIGQDMHVAFRVGLGEALFRGSSDEEMVQPSEHPLLHIVPGAVLPGGVDPEVIANGVFSRAMKRWRQKYDVVLVDSPPVLAVADAQILAQHAEGIVFVVQPGKSHRTHVMDALSALQSTGSQLWGTVFVRGHSNRNYGGYPYAYDYSSDTAKEEV